MVDYGQNSDNIGTLHKCGLHSVQTSIEIRPIFQASLGMSMEKDAKQVKNMNKIYDLQPGIPSTWQAWSCVCLGFFAGVGSWSSTVLQWPDSMSEKGGLLLYEHALRLLLRGLGTIGTFISWHEEIYYGNLLSLSDLHNANIFALRDGFPSNTNNFNAFQDSCITAH